MSADRSAEPQETLQWIKDWREGMFSSTSRDKDGWPIEMHGLAASYEELAARLDTSAAQTFEFGIGVGKAQAMVLHRSNMTREEADTWMCEWVQMTGRRAPFWIVRRLVGKWEDTE